MIPRFESMFWILFIALTLSVGWQEGHKIKPAPIIPAGFITIKHTHTQHAIILGINTAVNELLKYSACSNIIDFLESINLYDDL